MDQKYKELEERIGRLEDQLKQPLAPAEEASILGRVPIVQEFSASTLTANGYLRTTIDGKEVKILANS